MDIANARPSGCWPLEGGCLPLDMYGCIAEHVDDAHDVLALLATSSLLRRKVVIRLRWSHIRESNAKMYARIRRYTILRRFHYCFRCQKPESMASARARADADALALMSTMSCGREAYLYASPRCLPLSLDTKSTVMPHGVEFIAAANGISLSVSSVDAFGVFMGIFKHAIMHADMRMLRSTSLYVPAAHEPSSVDPSVCFVLTEFRWAVYDVWSAHSQRNASKYGAFLCELFDWSQRQADTFKVLIEEDILQLALVLDLVDVVRHVMPSCALIARQSSMIAIAWRAQTDAYRYLVASGHMPCLSAVADMQSQWALAAWKPADLFHHQPVGHPTHPCFYASILSWLNAAPSAGVMLAVGPILDAHTHYGERLVWQLPDDICIRVISYVAGVPQLLEVVGRCTIKMSLAVYKYLEQRQWATDEISRGLLHVDQSYALLCHLVEKYGVCGQSLFYRAMKHSETDADCTLLRLLLRNMKKPCVITCLLDSIMYNPSPDSLRIVFDSLGVEYERREEFYDQHIDHVRMWHNSVHISLSIENYAALMRHAPRLARRFTDAYEKHGYRRAEEEQLEQSQTPVFIIAS